MFNRNTGIVLLVALAAGLGLLLGQKFLGGTPRSPWPPTQTITFYPQPRPLPRSACASPMAPSWCPAN